MQGAAPSMKIIIYPERLQLKRDQKLAHKTLQELFKTKMIFVAQLKYLWYQCSEDGSKLEEKPSRGFDK